MTDELLNAAILLRRGSWVDPELFERAAKRMAELERRETEARDIIEKCRQRMTVPAWKKQMDGWLESHPLDNPGKVRVRIAVVTSDGGRWEAAKHEGDARAFLSHGTTDKSCQVTFVEADVPIPLSQTVQGESAK